MTSAMIHLGDRLGLYGALAAADGPLTAGELADAPVSSSGGCASGPTTRPRRRSWTSMARRRRALLDVTGGGGRPRRRRTTRRTGSGMFHRPAADDGSTRAAARELPHRSRPTTTTPTVRRRPPGMERSFEPWNRAHLLPDVLPELDGVAPSSQAGAQVADIGCGAGGAVLMLAEAFPASQVTGYDISRHALERADRARARPGLDNARSTIRGTTRCRPTTPSTSSRRSTASTT